MESFGTIRSWWEYSYFSLRLLQERWGCLQRYEVAFMPVETLMVWIWICSYLWLSMCTTDFILLCFICCFYCVSQLLQNDTVNLPLAVSSAWALGPCTYWFSCPGQSSGCVSPWRELRPFRQRLRLLGWFSLNGAVVLTHLPEESLSLLLIQKETYRWKEGGVFPLVAVSNFYNFINKVYEVATRLAMKRRPKQFKNWGSKKERQAGRLGDHHPLWYPHCQQPACNAPSWQSCGYPGSQILGWVET